MFTLFIIFSTVQTYTITYDDCTEPQNLQSYAVQSACTQLPPDQPQQQQYAILQRVRIEEIVGYSCAVEKSTLLALCGVWGHLKLRNFPEISHPESVSLEQCRKMINSMKFTTTTGEAIDLQLNTIAYVQNFDMGDVTAAGYCRGQTARVSSFGQSAVLNNVIKMNEYRVLIKREKYLLEDEKVESSTDHESFDCPPEQQGCVTAGRTFIWTYHGAKCPLQIANRILAYTTMKTYIVDEKKQILLNLTSDAHLSNCEFTNLKATEYADLYVSPVSEVSGLPDLFARNVYESLQTALTISYAVWNVEKKISSTNKQIAEEICDTIQQSASDLPVKIKDGRYLKLSGEAVMVFHCVTKTGVIKDAGKCYTDIPLVSGEFVSPRTRLVTNHSAQVPCNPRFPQIIYSAEGWIEIGHRIKPRQQPLKNLQLGLSDEEQQHIHVNQVSLYTPEEEAAWRDLLAFPQFERAVNKRVSIGACLHHQACQQEVTRYQVPTFDINQMASDMEEKLNPFHKILEFIHQYGDIMAFIVIVLYSVKFIMDVTMILWTAAQGGPGACIGLISRMYLSNVESFRRVRRRYQRVIAPAEERIELATTPPQPSQSVAVSSPSTALVPTNLAPARFRS